MSDGEKVYPGPEVVEKERPARLTDVNETLKKTNELLEKLIVVQLGITADVAYIKGFLQGGGEILKTVIGDGVIHVRDHS